MPYKREIKNSLISQSEMNISQIKFDGGKQGNKGYEYKIGEGKDFGRAAVP